MNRTYIELSMIVVGMHGGFIRIHSEIPTECQSPFEEKNHLLERKENVSIKYSNISGNRIHARLSFIYQSDFDIILENYFTSQCKSSLFSCSMHVRNCLIFNRMQIFAFISSSMPENEDNTSIFSADENFSVFCESTTRP